MFCPRCGSENLEEAKFCGKCGDDLSAIIEQPADQNKQEKNEIEKKKPGFFNFLFSIGGKRKLIITFGIILLIMLPVVFFSLDGNESGIHTRDVVTTENVNSVYGTRLDFNNSELFYTSSITYEEAEKLGEYLVRSGFFGGKKISLQIDKSRGKYLVRYVVISGYENDPEYLKIVNQMANEVSQNVFNNTPVEIHLTDTRFKTLKVVDQNSRNINNDTYTTAPDYTNNRYGKLLTFNGGELYYTNLVTRMQAQKLGTMLIDEGFFDGTRKTVQLTKDGNVFQFRFVVLSGLENDRTVLNNAKATADYLSAHAFNNKPVEVHLTDAYLRTLKTIKSGSGQMPAVY